MRSPRIWPSISRTSRGCGSSSSRPARRRRRIARCRSPKLRLAGPLGGDAIEPPLRARASEALGRGTIHANLTVQRAGVAPVVRVNEPVLAAVLSTVEEVIRRTKAAPPTADGILALKGVI